jgi:hypothetical protein
MQKDSSTINNKLNPKDMHRVSKKKFKSPHKGKVNK